MEKKERSRPSGKTQGKPEKLTSVNGRPIADNEDSQTAGLRGPIVLQDPWMLEKLAHFDREVIPERRMHAKGSGAYGTFTVTHDITRYTRASIFSRIGKQTECFVRFSTVAGERGAADAERDIRGFAMKFYTDAGNWDLVGNNTPVFFLRDPVRFPDLNHAIKRDPRTGMRSVDNNWDFWTLLPEALHQVTITMSTRGIPASFRHMHGFGSHTYSFYDAENRRTWVKFHLRTMQGIRNLTDAEAEAIIAKDRESHQRDLFEAIERGDFPRWLFQIQTMTEEEARNYRTADSEDSELHRGSQENLREHRGLRLFNMLLLGHKLNDEGRTLSLQLNGGFLGDNANTESHSTLHSVEGDQSQQTLLEDRDQTLNYRIRTGYVEPLTELLSLQAQLEWSDRIRSSERDYKLPDATGAWTQLDATMDTKMKTRLSSLSGGVDLKVANKLIDLTVGLRIRPTWMTTEQSQLASQEPLVRRETIWAPSLNFRYTPSKQTMLRLGYWGRSEMPSAGQMYSLPDATNLRESIVGNPDLRPSYQHQLFGMFRTFIPSTSQAINLRFFGAYTHHAVISDQTVDAKTQRRQITYINADGGEYMVHANGSFTTPFFTKSLSLAVSLGSAYNYRLGRINGVTNGAHSWTLSPNLSLAYSNSWLYLRAKGGLRYHYGSQSLQIATSPHTYDWSAGGDASVTLPLGFKVESEAIYTQGVGYQEPYNVASVLWSAGLSYSFLKNQAATLRIKVYDLLNEQQSIWRQVTATEISDTWSNSLGRYAMLHFIYRFRL